MITHLNKQPGSRIPQKQGFALIATISVMVLLALIALAMLSLSTISLREVSAEDAKVKAQNNARLGLMLALAELQASAGDDRRITADGSIIDESVASPHAVGVWESWSPGLAQNSQGNIPNYDQEKEERFLRWLVSGNETEITNLEWINSAPSGDQIDLYGEDVDGFDLQGQLITTNNDNTEGGYAWAITQENTKAKVNVGGPEIADREQNDDLEVQPRPNVGQSGILSQPEDQWNERAAKVITLGQVDLDPDLAADTDTASLGEDFTTTSFGILTDPINGGLKVDMSLGFGMSDADFAQDSWTSNGETFDNPFRKIAENNFTVPASYQEQRPLYQPIVETGTFSDERVWDRGTLDQVHSYYPVTSVPTFDTLRSFYRIPYHLYQTNGQPTVFEREGDHIAAAEGPVAANFTRPPHIAAEGSLTQMSIRPVLDRVLFLFSLSLRPNNTPSYTITPIITLWNPYNTAMEIEGAVAYPWLDLAIRRTFQLERPNGNNASNGQFISRDLQTGIGSALVRQIQPYIVAAVTADGQPITGTAEPIRFEPGQVRVFVPRSPTAQEFVAQNSSIRERTVFMRPVDNIGDYEITGGFNVTPLDNGANGLVMSAGDSLGIDIELLQSSGTPFPLCIGLSDATLAKGSSSPAETARGKIITDIFASTFTGTQAARGALREFSSPQIPFATLQSGPAPVFTLEVFHRVAQSGQTSQDADLVYTGNPRQSSMNPVVTNAEFEVGPQYDIRFREVSSVNSVLEVTGNSGQPAAFYGESQSASSGRTNLSFFEIPRNPMLSLAGFQHADLSPTPFASANQFANSWASAYVPRDQVIDGTDGLEIDHSYFVNEALWDSYFLSSIAPVLEPGNTSGASTIWNSPIANETSSLENVLEEFAEDSSANPLRNARMRLRPDSLEGMTPTEFASTMAEPEACLKIAGNLMVDGAFNVNSTSVNAWVAILTGLRDSSFELGDGSNTVQVTDTPFPRFRDPLGTEDDNWQGFRSLDDTQITELAENIVEQVRLRGPFMSLGEFVNRRPDDSEEFGLSGALQTAIDDTPSINESALQGSYNTSTYDGAEADNISPADTGVGIPGYLTQADLLKSIAPVITVRSDTFTIRSYGETRDSNGEITAQAWIEATVQRFPDFMDDNDASYTQIDDLSETNQRFGRRFRIVSFRFLSANEARDLSTN